MSGSKPKISRRCSFTSTDFIRKDTNKKSMTLGYKELPVAFDVLKTVVHFCFPGEMLGYEKFLLYSIK